MNLQDLFYALAIAYFISSWIVIIGVVVVGVLLYRKVRAVQGNLLHLTTSLPVVSMAFPIVAKVFKWWRRR